MYLNIDGTSSVNGGIQSLQGLEAFVNLKWLRSSYNQITTVDLSVCPQLEYFYASNSGIVNLGLTNCSNLQTSRTIPDKSQPFPCFFVTDLLPLHRAYVHKTTPYENIPLSTAHELLLSRFGSKKSHQ